MSSRIRIAPSRRLYDVWRWRWVNGFPRGSDRFCSVCGAIFSSGDIIISVAKMIKQRSYEFMEFSKKSAEPGIPKMAPSPVIGNGAGGEG